jgi:hypothetical protein
VKLHTYTRRMVAGVAFETLCGLTTDHEHVVSPERATCENCKRIYAAKANERRTVKYQTGLRFER